MEITSHLLAIAGLLVPVLLYNLWRLRISCQKTKGMLAPEPSGALPIIGHLHQLRGKNPLARTLAAMADRHGPVFKIRLGSKSAVVVCNHEAVKECFTTNDKVLAGRPKSTQSKYLGYNNAGLGFAPYGAYWREMRKLAMMELLSAHRLETLQNVKISEVDTLVKDLYSLCQSNNHSPVKVMISDWIESLTLNIITKIIAGKRYFGQANGGDDEEAKRVQKIIKEFMCLVGAPLISDLLPFLGWIDFGGQVKSVKRLGRELDTLIGSWIEEHALKRLEREASDKQADFIDIMLSVIEGDSMFGHTRETIIKAMVSTFILAGAETTSVNLIWLLSLLLNNEHALKRVQEELDLKVGKDRWVEDYDIKDMVYLRAIVKESLRLYPPTPLAVPHEALEDCQVCGYYVPKGTRLLVNVWKLHRDPRVWEDPNGFLPERFLTSHAHIDALGQHFEFTPFGLGRRSCPGNTFAMQISHLAIARLLQGFELTTPENISVDMTEGFGITLPRTTPLQVLLTPRLSSELYGC
ncbi:hypothetical protein I3842_13G050800 [Carya illinoinensis]|uniref:Cytochrome P450 n=1 Tax=Carya illinoinensis TaxID=32201 RepID=A0A922AM04_CARIL|nr:hypothetical protein I3842_13G050800 [Carya illinoinensis]KAG6680610.1 hypothetical protein I3842_13G050800 [Carya illinoinensis]